MSSIKHHVKLHLSVNWIVSVFLILSATLLYSSAAKSDEISLKLLPVEQGICNNRTLPEGLSHLDPVLNKVVVCTDKYIGLETWNKRGSQGFRLYDKNLNLLWDLKPLTFEEIKKRDLSSDEELRFNDVAISPNADVVILMLGGRGDLGGNIGMEIYRKTIFGYKKSKKINFSSDCHLAIDEERGRIYTAGFFPNRQESRELKVKCFTIKGKQIWEQSVPKGSSGREINVSSGLTVQFFYHVRSRGNGALLLDHSGEVIANATERGSCAADLSKDGKVALFSGDGKIHVYDIHPYSERFTLELERNPEWEIFSIRDVAISPDNEMIAALCQVKSPAGRESRIFVFDRTGAKLVEKGTMEWGINPQRLEFEDDRNIRLDTDWKVIIEN